MNPNKAKKSVNASARLESLGWNKIAPGVYVGQHHFVNSDKQSSRITEDPQTWTEKFKEAKEKVEGKRG